MSFFCFNRQQICGISGGFIGMIFKKWSEMIQKSPNEAPVSSVTSPRWATLMSKVSNLWALRPSVGRALGSPTWRPWSSGCVAQGAVCWAKGRPRFNTKMAENQAKRYQQTLCHLGWTYIWMQQIMWGFLLSLIETYLIINDTIWSFDTIPAHSMKASNFASKIWVSIKLPDSHWQQHDDHLCDDVREPCILLKPWLFCLARMLKSSEGTRYMKICWVLLLTHSISAAQNSTPATGVERKSQSCSALKVLAVICAHNQDENSNQKHDMSFKLLSRQKPYKFLVIPHRNHSWTTALLYAFVTLRSYVMSRHWDEFLRHGGLVRCTQSSSFALPYCKTQPTAWCNKQTQILRFFFGELLKVHVLLDVRDFTLQQPVRCQGWDFWLHCYA